jgi:anti-anti-sigma regulatory factor
MSTGEQMRERFLSFVRAVLDRPGTPGDAAIDDLRDAAQALLDSHAWQEATIAARDAQISAYRAVLAHFAFPVLQVREDVLCVPVFGELDGERAARLTEAVVAITVARGVALVVLDLTGALLASDTPLHLVRVFQILEQLGVRAALSGVGPEVAEALARHPEALREVRCFTELAHALAALSPRSRALRAI